MALSLPARILTVHQLSEQQ